MSIQETITNVGHSPAMSTQGMLGNAALRIAIRESVPREVRGLRMEVAALRTQLRLTRSGEAKAYRQARRSEKRAAQLRRRIIVPARKNVSEALRHIRIQGARTTNFLNRGVTYNHLAEAERILGECDPAREPSDEEDVRENITCIGCGSDMGVKDVEISPFYRLKATGIWTDVPPTGRIVCATCRYERCTSTLSLALHPASQELWTVEAGFINRQDGVRCVVCNCDNKHEFCLECQ